MAELDNDDFFNEVRKARILKNPIMEETIKSRYIRECLYDLGLFNIDYENLDEEEVKEKLNLVQSLLKGIKPFFPKGKRSYGMELQVSEKLLDIQSRLIQRLISIDTKNLISELETFPTSSPESKHLAASHRAELESKSPEDQQVIGGVVREDYSKSSKYLIGSEKAESSRSIEDKYAEEISEDQILENEWEEMKHQESHTHIQKLMESLREHSEELNRINQNKDKQQESYHERQKFEAEMLERKSKVWFRLLERESASTIIGGILLILIMGFHVISPFLKVTIPETLDNAFLIILGYFFGQSTAGGSRRSASD